MQNKNKGIFGKLFAVTAFCVAFIFIESNLASAYIGPISNIGGVTVSTDGWARTDSTGLGQNDIFVDPNKVNLNRACSVSTLSADECATVSIQGNALDFITSETYTAAEMASGGRFDQERTTKYSFHNNKAGDHAIIVKGDYIRNIQSSNAAPRAYNLGSGNSVSIMWPKAAKTQDGDELDLEMTIDNITVYLSGNRISGHSILEGKQHYSNNALQEFQSSSLKHTDGTDLWEMKRMGGYYDGDSYDVTVKLYYHNDDPSAPRTLVDASESAMAMLIKDLDTIDSTNYNNQDGKTYWSTTPGTVAGNSATTHLTLNGGRTGNSDRYLDQNGVASNYVESVEIVSGLKDGKVFSLTTNNENNASTDDEEGTYAYFSKRNNHLLISGTASTQNADSLPSDETSGFLALVDARGFTYRWSGSHCATKFGFVGVSTVATSLGINANHMTITPSDNEVTWRENKSITITVDSGYELSTIMIDGYTHYASDLAYIGTVGGKRQYQYTFRDVITDHEIIANAQPILTKICKTDGANNLAGVELMLAGTIESDPIDFSIDPIIASGITNLSHNNYELVWRTTNECASIYALPDGEYRLTETVALTGYAVAGDITFRIVDGEITGSNPANALTSPGVITMRDRQLTTGKLRVEKHALGSGADLNKSFSITLRITGSADGVIPTSVSCTDGTNASTLNFVNNEAAISMKPEEYLECTFNEGIAWEIQEADYSAEGYTTTYSSQTGVITGNNQTDLVIISNTKDVPIPTGVSTDHMRQIIILASILVAGIVCVVIGKHYKKSF